MKTLEQALEGVTAGGKFKAVGSSLLDMRYDRDAEYAERACSTWPELVRALQSIAAQSYPRGDEAAVRCRLEEMARDAEKALAEALK